MGLHEHDRSLVGWLARGEFEAAIARLFERPGGLVLGSETADQAHARFVGAVAGVIERYPEETVAVVAHGTVIALFVARAAGLEPFGLWKRLGLPSFVVLSRPTLELLAIVEEV
jgi:broad specificity phosphatase PhoE